MQYGRAVGDKGMLESLAAFLRPHYGTDVDPASLVLTTGASHGLTLLCSMLFARGDTVYIEDPTYLFAPHVLGEFGFTQVPVRLDSEGLVPEDLERAIAERPPSSAGQGGYSGMIYCIPTFHNPTGATLPDARRRRIVELAREHNLLVVCDDVYELLYFNGQRPPPRLFHYDGPEGRHVVSNSTFSKILSPGVRLGWLECGHHVVALMKQFAMFMTGGSFNQFASGIVKSLIDTGLLEEQVRYMQSTFQDRVEKVKAALAAHMPEADFSDSAGGMCVWVRLPADVGAEELLKHVIETEVPVRFKVGPWFSITKSQENRACFRIAVAHYSGEEYAAAIQHLAAAMDAFRGSADDCSASASGGEITTSEDEDAAPGQGATGRTSSAGAAPRGTPADCVYPIAVLLRVYELGARAGGQRAPPRGPREAAPTA